MSFVQQAPIVVLLALTALGSACAEGGSQCGDDVDNDGDGFVDCTDTGCSLDPRCQACGNGRLDAGEACDDGNTNDDDQCTRYCRSPDCGNGNVDNDEACDDGNRIPGDGCNSYCQIDHCGDFTINDAEECDDGNRAALDGCDASCHIERGYRCGDGRIDNAFLETCDDGNRRSGDGCSLLCRIESCGDGVVQTAVGEECEFGTPNCVGCRWSLCSNGEIDPGETCDDGNGDNNVCTTECLPARCGDFVVNEFEECDDGNSGPGDGCSATCTLEFCGDGVRQPALGELCDVGDQSSPNEQCESCALVGVCLADDAALCFATQYFNTATVVADVAVVGTPPVYLGTTPLAMFEGGLVSITTAAGESLQQWVAVNAPRAVDAVTTDSDVRIVIGGQQLALYDDAQLAPNRQRYLDPLDGAALIDVAFGHVVDALVLDVVGLTNNDEVLVWRDVDALLNGAPTERTTLTAPVGAHHLACAKDRVGCVVVADNAVMGFGFNGGGAQTQTTADLGIAGSIVDVALRREGNSSEAVLVAHAPDSLVLLPLLPELSVPTVVASPGADHVAIGDFDGDTTDDVVVSGAQGLVRLHLAQDGFVHRDTWPSLLDAGAVVVRASAPDHIDIGVVSTSQATLMRYQR